MRNSRPVAFWLALMVAVAAQGAEQQVRYLSPKAVQARYLLPAPPSAGSDEYKAEIDEMLALQGRRSDVQVKQFRAQESLGLGAFMDIMPDWCTPDNLPKLKTLIKTVSKAASGPVDNGKNYFKRARPFREDNRIQPLGTRDQEFAYPSGHATRGILYAKILAQLEPDKADVLMERGRQIGWNRVIGGMHHPSDIAAGRVLGQAIARALLRDADFKAELKDVKDEYEAVKRAHAEAAAPVLAH
jgi:acid phosphatase (class A)